MIMTSEDRDDFNAATVCHISGYDLLSDKVRDYCHLQENMEVLLIRIAIQNIKFLNSSLSYFTTCLGMTVICS